MLRSLLCQSWQRVSQERPVGHGADAVLELLAALTLEYHEAARGLVGNMQTVGIVPGTPDP